MSFLKQLRARKEHYRKDTVLKGGKIQVNNHPKNLKEVKIPNSCFTVLSLIYKDNNKIIIIIVVER